ncbi:MAG: winged helix-turn-helix domain-containing protein [Candidatus Jordarchaeum sp.]|uniref:winged helix-turn-helix domain-containing protein n=1 Tax=Candidatus Jordarchaeum sp. TaxID=2823881 RepID=UPI004049A029
MDDTANRIMEILSEGPKTPDEIAKRLRVSWATANGKLHQLIGSGKVDYVRKGRVNIFFLKSPQSLGFEVPVWVKSKSLAELAEELEPYFEEEITAADIVRRERRKY